MTESSIICLFGVYRPTREFFTHDATITGKGLQILTHVQHLWPFICEGSLACTPTVIQGILYNGCLRGPMTLAPIAERLAVELSLPAFKT